MLQSISELLDQTLTHQWLATVGLLAGSIFLRWIAIRGITSAPIRSMDLRRRWIVQIRNTCFLLIALGLVVIWSPQLRTAALSVVAIGVALVVATKELLQCISGGFLKATSGSFTLGDRISVKGFRGDVIDQTLLTTRILEIGPGDKSHHGTSRAITIPNSIMLNEPVINESFTEKYVLHTFTIPIAPDEDWQQAEKDLLTAANQACGGFLENARKHITKLTRKQGLDTPSVEPRVIITIPEPKRIDLIMRVPAPAHRKGFIEQDILRHFLTHRKKPDGTVSPTES